MYTYEEIMERYPLLPLMAGTGLAFWTYYIFNVVKKPLIACNSRFQTFLNAYCPIVNEKYWPTPWCFESRAITIMRSLYKSCPSVLYKRELLKLSDGGQVALDWCEPDISKKIPDTTSISTILILPGLVGSSSESYALHLVQEVQKLGYRAVVFNNRGNGGIKLLTPRTYNATNTEDLCAVVKHIQNKYPNSSIVATGISLGGLILTNYLAKAGKSSGLAAAMTVSVPYEMFESWKALEKPTNMFLFNRHLANSLVDAFKQHCNTFDGSKFFVYEDVCKSRTIRQFDDSFTARQFGYASSQEYYEDACIHEKLGKVEVPLLCLNAQDDAFSPGHAIPLEAARQSENVCIVMTSHGGHIGFLEGLHPRHQNYMDRMFAQYISAICEHREDLVKGN